MFTTNPHPHNPTHNPQHILIITLMDSVIVTAPAKVNLFLKVLSQRKDSYHNILTLFERISLADTIKISKIPEGINVRSDVIITKNKKDNIAYKAADLILKYKKIKSGVRIDIKKRIPIAGGLGGGSSDAAATLVGINKLFRLKLSDNILVKIGKKLGADVPFFLSNASFAIGRGRGDKLEVIESRSHFWHLLINPGIKLSTKEVYKAFDLTPNLADVKMNSLSKLQMDYAWIETMLYNDLEKAAISKKEIIGKILKGLAQLLGRNAIVSGSGPSLFCLYRTRKEAIKAKKTVLSSVPARKRIGWQIFVVGTCYP